MSESSEIDFSSFLRPSVKVFAIAMEQKLRANDHKTGWKHMDARQLLILFCEELLEFLQTFKPSEETSLNWILIKYHVRLMIDLLKRIQGWLPLQTTNKTTDEAVDLGNYAMMLFEVCNASRQYAGKVSDG